MPAEGMISAKAARAGEGTPRTCFRAGVELVREILFPGAFRGSRWPLADACLGWRVPLRVSVLHGHHRSRPVVTTGLGRHVYFRQPPGVPLGNSLGACREWPGRIIFHLHVRRTGGAWLDGDSGFNDIPFECSNARSPATIVG
jgi:hypothetical protein